LSSRPLLPLRLVRLANPVVRFVLSSPLHPALSGRLLVLTYVAHRSGRTFSIPLRFAVLPDGRLVAVAVRPARKRWWRSFVAPRGATVVLRGKDAPVTGTLSGGQARVEAVAAYTARYPGSRHLLEDAALVVFELSG
jgi:hypothetical protein